MELIVSGNDNSADWTIERTQAVFISISNYCILFAQLLRVLGYYQDAIHSPAWEIYTFHHNDRGVGSFFMCEHNLPHNGVPYRTRINSLSSGTLNRRQISHSVHISISPIHFPVSPSCPQAHSVLLRVPFVARLNSNAQRGRR